jgi:hypothetical protein
VQADDREIANPLGAAALGLTSKKVGNDFHVEAQSLCLMQDAQNQCAVTRRGQDHFVNKPRARQAGQIVDRANHSVAGGPLVIQKSANHSAFFGMLLQVRGHTPPHSAGPYDEHIPDFVPRMPGAPHASEFFPPPCKQRHEVETRSHANDRDQTDRRALQPIGEA